MTTLPDVLDLDQVAQLLDCEPSTVGEVVRQRRLPGLKYGRSWRFPREALLAELNRQALAALGPAPAPTPAKAATLHVVPPAAKKATRRRGSPAPLGDPPARAGGAT